MAYDIHHVFRSTAIPRSSKREATLRQYRLDYLWWDYFPLKDVPPSSRSFTITILVQGNQYYERSITIRFPVNGFDSSPSPPSPLLCARLINTNDRRTPPTTVDWRRKPGHGNRWGGNGTRRGKEPPRSPAEQENCRGQQGRMKRPRNEQHWSPCLSRSLAGRTTQWTTCRKESFFPSYYISGSGFYRQ